MTPDKLKKLVCEIVEEACRLKDKHTEQYDAPVHYACLFAQNQEEFDSLVRAIQQIGSIKKDTPKGPLYEVEAFDTAGGPLRLVKVRIPDQTRPERGDADFAVNNYDKFKKTVLSLPGFKLIPRETFEMIELMDPDFNVRVYFSNPPVEEQYGLTR